MSAIDTIRDKAKRFGYKNMGDAISDLRVLLDEIDRLKNDNVRLLASVRSEAYQVGDAYGKVR